MINNECILQRPSVENFSNNLKNAWHRHLNTAPISWNIRGQQSKGNNIFTIRHFANDVIYSTVYYQIFLISLMSCVT